MTKYAARGLALEFEGDAIGQLTQFGTFGSSRDLIDASAYGEEWKDYVLGQQDGDEVPFAIAYDPDDAAHQAVIAAYEDTPDATVTFTATHVPTGAAWDITCRITALARGGNLGELFQLVGTLKIVEPGVEQVAS